MNGNAARFFRLGVGLVGLLALGCVLTVSAAKPSRRGIALPTDWSHSHLVFSQPRSVEQAMRLQEDPRYGQQLYRRALPLMLPPDQKEWGGIRSPQQPHLRFPVRFRPPVRSTGLWSQSLGAGAGVGAVNFPAKFSFNSGVANCGSDYVVYSTGLAGSGSQASLIAYNNLYSGCEGINLGSASNFAVLGATTVTNAGNSVVTGGDIGISPGTSLTGFPPGILTPPATEQLATPTASQAQADASTAFTHYNGLTGATLIGPTLDALTFAPGLYKATGILTLDAGQTVTLSGSGTYVFQIASGFSVSGTVLLTNGATAGNVLWVVGSSATLSGTSSVSGTILALTSISLAAGDSLTGRAIALNGAVTLSDNAITTVDTLPSVYWAYNTGGQILTSPVLSLDGTQIAFAQSVGGVGSLVLLKWAASSGETVANPGAPTNVLPPAGYSTCTAPCMTTIALVGAAVGNDDRTSSVYYDYGSDTAWVGDFRGYLHRFHPVFAGPPAEVVVAPWPVQLQPSDDTPLASPVYDSGSGNVFVGDKGGYFYSVSAATGAVTQSSQLDIGTGIVSGPLVDSTAGVAYVFSSNDGSASCSGGPCAAVYSFPAGFTGGAAGNKVAVGASATTPNSLYEGELDSAYENSTSSTGNLYVCGNTGGQPTLYQVHIAAGSVVSPAVAGPALASGTTGCSPVTDFLNPNATGGATEFIFASAQTDGVSTPCAGGGCIMNFKSTPWLATTAYTVGQEVVDSHFQVQMVSTAGTSGGSAPTWSTTALGTTHDGTGTLEWLNLGLTTAATPASWAASHTYAVGDFIEDSNQNIEVVTGPTGGGMSGPAQPSWMTGVGETTADGSRVTWTNAGPATGALATAGGTSGVIIDNIVETGGSGSQIYFSTQSNQATCGTATSVGCAVQASQSALQ
jgi:Ice-binding-like